MSYLVDANVLSEAVRREPDTRVLSWLRVNDSRLYLSTITLGEVEKGILRLSDGTRRRRLEQWLSNIQSTMSGKLIPFGELEASTWARYFEQHRASGRILPTVDSMVAATAIANNLAIVSRNVVDFPGINVVNPWT